MMWTLLLKVSLVSLVFFLLVAIPCFSMSPQSGSRRQALKTIATVAGSSSCLWVPSVAQAENDDLVANMVIRSRGNKSGQVNVLSVPRVGYSLFKTDAFQADYCVQLALRAGIRHFDLASSYNNNEKVGDVLPSYLYKGTSSNKAEQALTKAERRHQLFVAHKVSNKEQSTNRSQVKQSVKTELSKLGVGYLDLCYVHSPLTDRKRRLSTYEALLELQQEGIVKAVGVANYGVSPLDEIVDAGLPPPSVIQLELSPFNQHTDVVDWAKSHSSIVSCAAWSMLSSPSGPSEGWQKLCGLAETKGMTPAQVLVRWSCQSGYLCVPRSGSKKQAQRDAIRDNAYPSIKNFKLTDKEMALINSLNVNYPAGSLDRRDGWSASDVVDKSWDPTLAV